MDVMDAIAIRRANRAFAGRPVEREKVAALLEAMRLAPSCNNNQPWRVVVCSRENLRSLMETLYRGNEWATAAPLIKAVTSKPSLDCRMNGGRDYYQFSCGLAVGQMLLRATELGLTAHPIAGYDPVKVREACGIPSDYVVITLVICGYPGEDTTLLTEKQLRQQKERPERLPPSETFFDERWGEPFPE